MIICLGPTPALARTMTFEKIVVDEVNRALRVHHFAAGKATNVARVLHTLGYPALVTGFLGGDTARIFQNNLDRAGIAHDFVNVEPCTRTAITAIDESAGTATELLEEAQPLLEADYVALIAKLSQLLKSARVLVLSGRLPPSANANFYAQCVQLAEPTVRVIVDTVGEPLLATLQQRPFAIKMNQSEIAQTLAMKIDSEKKLQAGMHEIISRGAQWAIVTRGREDTLITNGKSFWSVSTPAVKVVSAIGSGDAFAAGLAAGISEGSDVPNAAILAAACGGANAMTPYAGHVSAEEVRDLSGKIRLTK